MDSVGRSFYSNDVFNDYEYFFILDDDITFNHGSNINTLFELSKKELEPGELSPNLCQLEGHPKSTWISHALYKFC